MSTKDSKSRLYLGIGLAALLLIGLPVFAYTYYPAPRTVLEQMWTVRTQVWSALKNDQPAVALTQLDRWAALADKTPIAMRLYGKSMSPDARRRLEEMQNGIRELKTALQTDSTERIKKTATRCFDAHHEWVSIVNRNFVDASPTPSKSLGDHVCIHKQYEVPDDLPKPTIKAIVHKDPKAGWNLQVVTTNFRFAPENSGKENVPGEGHCHLYINGRKITRLYGEWYLINELPPGENEIVVAMSCNNHDEYAVDGNVVADQVTVTVEDNREDVYFSSR